MKQWSNTRRLSLCALFVAISIVCKYVLEIYITESFRLGFSHIPIFLSSFVVGPVWGGVIGGITDFVGYLLRPMGPYHFGFCFTNILMGVLPFVFVKAIEKLFNQKHLHKTLGIIFTGCYALTFVFLYWYHTLTLPVVLMACGLYVYLAVGYLIVQRCLKKQAVLLGINIAALYFSLALTHIITSILLNGYFLSQLYGAALLAMLPLRILKTLVLIPIDTYLVSVLAGVMVKNKVLQGKEISHGSQN